MAIKFNWLLQITLHMPLKDLPKYILTLCASETEKHPWNIKITSNWGYIACHSIPGTFLEWIVAGTFLFRSLISENNHKVFQMTRRQNYVGITFFLFKHLNFTEFNCFNSFSILKFKFIKNVGLLNSSSVMCQFQVWINVTRITSMMLKWKTLWLPNEIYIFEI